MCSSNGCCILWGFIRGLAPLCGCKAETKPAASPVFPKTQSFPKVIVVFATTKCSSIKKKLSGEHMIQTSYSLFQNVRLFLLSQFWFLASQSDDTIYDSLHIERLCCSHRWSRVNLRVYDRHFSYSQVVHPNYHLAPALVVRNTNVRFWCHLGCI
jgi:hypothetical protein